jgi:hypothetical protein
MPGHPGQKICEMASTSEKKRKLEKDVSVCASADDAAGAVVPAMDTSKWPLLLKVCQHLFIFSDGTFIRSVEL